jgi:hypothetical protein
MDGRQLFISQGLWQMALPGGNLRRTHMLWTITVILLVLWLLGVVSGYTLGNWIYALLVIAVIIAIFNLLSGRRAL